MSEAISTKPVKRGRNAEQESIELLPMPQDEGQAVLALMQQALMQPGGVEALGQLVELQERVSRRRAELEFSSALAEFQRTCPPVKRSSTASIATKGGGSFKYTYADLEEIIETVRPHLASQRMSFSFDSGMDGKVLTCTCTLRHANGHAVTSRFTLTTESTSAMSEQQKVGAALTFAKRQALISVLGLALTEVDPEAERERAMPTISDEQEATLDALIAETGADRTKLLAYFQLDRLSEMKAGSYAEALRILERRRGGGK